MNLIKTTTIEKTGTIIEKISRARKHITYGPETNMVRNYGVKKIEVGPVHGFDFSREDSGKRLDIILDNGNKIIFHTKPYGQPIKNEYVGNGTVGERFNQLLKMLELTKKA